MTLEVYNASGMTLTGVVNGYSAQTIDVSGTFTWDTVSQTGSWNISAPLQTFSAAGPFNVGYFMAPGSSLFIYDSSSTAWSETWASNSSPMQGDASVNFSPALGGAGQVGVSGSFSYTNDQVYDVSGTFGGVLTPVTAAVPEPGSLVLLLIGLTALAWARRLQGIPLTASRAL